MSWPHFNIVLYEPEIPQNTGNIGRTCVAASAKLWIVRPAAFRLDDHHLRRSGLDYWQHLDWTPVNDWSELMTHVGERRIWYFSKSGKRPYSQIRYESGDFLVFGNESEGLPRDMLGKHADETIRIPTSDKVRSLNLSNAVAIALYEAVRQSGALG